MLDKLIAKSKFVAQLERDWDSALQRQRKDSADTTEKLLDKMQEAESALSEANHCLDIERSKRIAAEQIAVARGNELDWLREQFQRSEDARDAANSEQLQSLNLVNTALLKQTEAEAPPSRETLQSFKPIPKRTVQVGPMMRRATGELIRGLQAKSRKAAQPLKVEKAN